MALFFKIFVGLYLFGDNWIFLIGSWALVLPHLFQKIMTPIVDISIIFVLIVAKIKATWIKADSQDWIEMAEIEKSR